MDRRYYNQMIISTHATHKGGDGRVDGLSYLNYNISTPATHKGGDGVEHVGIYVGNGFQLTPPIRVATR